MEMFVFAAIAGILVGVLSGLLGIGGGVIMVPMFRLLFGLEPLAATATSLFTIIPTSLSGMTKHVRNKTCIPRVGLLCGVAGAFLSPIGVLAASASPAWAVMAAAALVIGYSAFTMFKKALAAPKAGAAGKGAGAKAQPQAADFAPAFTPAFVAKAVGIGIIAGFMSGYIGVGGGFIMVPLFMALLGVPMRLASGTSLLAVCILAIPGAVEQGILGNIDYLVGIATAAGSIPGAFLGASLVKRVPERSLRFGFAAFLLVVAVILVVNELLVI